jgi:hypothetical protein
MPDFSEVADGLTMPGKYSVQFTQELQNGTTEVLQWEIAADEISNNRPLDPKNFLIK